MSCEDCDCYTYDSYDYSTDYVWSDGRTDLREEILYELRKTREEYLNGDLELTVLEAIDSAINTVVCS